MIFLAIMLFMIGQALNMGVGYWIIFWILTIFNVLEMFLKNCKYSLSNIIALGIVVILEKVFGEQRLLKFEKN